MALICLAYGVLKKARLRAELTDRRVIVKGGVLSRYETDMALSRIESIAVIQTFAERLTDGGTILLRGIGGTTLVLPVLKNFGEFREACERQNSLKPGGKVPLNGQLTFSYKQSFSAGSPSLSGGALAGRRNKFIASAAPSASRGFGKK